MATPSRTTIFVTICHPERFAPRQECTETHIINFIHKRCSNQQFPMPVHTEVVAMPGETIDVVIARFKASFNSSD